MFVSLIVIPILSSLLFLYLYIKHKYSYWRKLGVKGPPPSIFKLGNFSDIQGESLLAVELALREKYGSTYGTYTGLAPTLTITDPELIKQVLIKDFSLFTNRRQDQTNNDLLHKMHFFSQDQTWRRVRKVIGPNFTSGKLKRASPLMNQCVDQLEVYFTQLSGSGESMADTREVITGYTIQTIAATSFGAQTRSNGDRSQVNPFVVNGHKVSDISAFQGVSYFVMPKWFNVLFRVKSPFNQDSYNFFTSTTKAILKERKQTPDVGTQTSLVQLLFNTSKKEASSNLKESLSDEEIIASAVSIFMAGYDTTALALSSCLYELALHPDIQERLFEELEGALTGLEVDSEAYYDTIMGPATPYLDAVIKETLRKYPPLVRLERRCTATNGYTLGSIPLVKDQLVEISTLAVHYSEALYPEPFSFKPSRFLPENKHQIVSGSFLPFGDGPRNCVGMRYAYQEIKLCLSRILRRFRFQTTPETPKQLVFLPFKFVTQSEPIPLKVVQRTV